MAIYEKKKIYPYNRKLLKTKAIVNMVFIHVK